MRIPNKNLVRVGNQSLLGRAFTHAEKISTTLLGNGITSQIVISTDIASDSITAEIGPKDKGYLLLERPEQLASGTAVLPEVLEDVLFQLRLLNKSFEGVLVLQPTSPFRDTQRIADELVRRKLSQSLFSVSPVRSVHPDWMMVVEADGSFQWLTSKDDRRPRSQDLTPLFVPNGNFFFLSLKDLNSKAPMSTTPQNAAAVVVSSIKESLDIDLPEDLELARLYANAEPSLT